MSYTAIFRITCTIIFFLSLQTHVFAECSSVINNMYSELLPHYQQHITTHPNTYTLISKEKHDSLEILTYQLTSQEWSPHNLVSPEKWVHAVEIFIPEKPYTQRAFVVINNGILHNIDNKPPVQPNNYTSQMLKTIAQATNTIVISISDVPNQYLTFKPEEKPYNEDAAIARSWSLFLNEPKEQYMLPLQIPMATAVSQALNLAEQELKPWSIEHFILSGASKRGLTAWLVALTDPRVDALVPFVIDILDTKKILDHMYRTYGGNWPIAFYPYYQQNIEEFLNTAPFNYLMQVVDPVQYLKTNTGYPLTIPKYIVNVSGDDFFPPDNISYYYNELPEIKTLRVIPNSDHYIVSSYIEPCLVTFINRIQQNISLPQIYIKKNEEKLQITFSEPPVKIKQWTAQNPYNRDFRYACGIRYTSKLLKKPKIEQPLLVSIKTPAKGWQATFIEATFSDGFIVTTPVYITPDSYPKQYHLPEQDAQDSLCKVLPGQKNKIKK